MTDYTELVRALRHCAGDIHNCQSGCEYAEKGSMYCQSYLQLDASDAIEAMQAELDKEGKRVEHLLARVNELEDKQMYCDAYGDKWMTSGKDVPTEAYKHGYADGWDEAQKQIDALEADNINLEIALDKANTQMPKRGEAQEGKC